MVSVTQSLARNPRSLRAAVRFCVPSACCVHPALPVPASLSAGINHGSKCLKSSSLPCSQCWARRPALPGLSLFTYAQLSVENLWLGGMICHFGFSIQKRSFEVFSVSGTLWRCWNEVCGLQLVRRK